MTITTIRGAFHPIRPPRHPGAFFFRMWRSPVLHANQICDALHGGRKATHATHIDAVPGNARLCPHCTKAHHARLLEARP